MVARKAGVAMYPTCRYHPTEAPLGRIFTDQAAMDALGPAWVDTPAKFSTVTVEPEASEVVASETPATHELLIDPPLIPRAPRRRAKEDV